MESQLPALPVPKLLSEMTEEKKTCGLNNGLEQYEIEISLESIFRLISL